MVGPGDRVQFLLLAGEQAPTPSGVEDPTGSLVGRRALARALPGPEGSITKLLGTQTEQLLHHVAMDLVAPEPLVGSRPDVLGDYLYSRAASIYRGTSEIQRTLVAERLLHLPRGG